MCSTQVGYLSDSCENYASVKIIVLVIHFSRHRQCLYMQLWIIQFARTTFFPKHFIVNVIMLVHFLPKPNFLNTGHCNFKNLLNNGSLINATAASLSLFLMVPNDQFFCTFCRVWWVSRSSQKKFLIQSEGGSATNCKFRWEGEFYKCNEQLIFLSVNSI